METLVLMTTVYFFIFTLRYLVLSFSGFGLISLLPGRRKIQEDKQVTREQKIRELKHSLFASIPSSIIISFVVYLGYLGLNKVYFDISQYGILWFFGQIYFSWYLQTFGFILFTEQCIQKNFLDTRINSIIYLQTRPLLQQTRFMHLRQLWI